VFVLGWASIGYTVFDVGKYSILLIYIAAIPFCTWITVRSFSFVMLPLVSTIFSVTVGMLQHVPTMSIISQAALQLLSILFAAGVASLDWRKHLLTLTKAMVVVAVPIVLYGIYQLIARPTHRAYAFLPVTNQQAYADGGLQRGWGKDPFYRASSFFVEPSDYGYYCLWLLVLGLSASKGRWRYCAIGLALAGILSAQSLSGVLGVGLVLLVYVVSNPISVRVVRQIAIVGLFCILAVFAVQPLVPQAFAKFSLRIEQALSLNSEADSGRVDHLPACWAIISDAPVWGHGIASINSADQNGTDVTSISYALLLMERGAVGTIFFLAPWLLIGVRSRLMPAADTFRTPAILLTGLHLYCFSTFSLAYFLPFWLSLGITASLVLGTYKPATELAFKSWNGFKEFGAPAEA
jgi:hypothetical protein